MKWSHNLILTTYWIEAFVKERTPTTNFPLQGYAQWCQSMAEGLVRLDGKTVATLTKIALYEPLRFQSFIITWWRILRWFTSAYLCRGPLAESCASNSRERNLSVLGNQRSMCGDLLRLLTQTPIQLTSRAQQLFLQVSRTKQKLSRKAQRKREVIWYHRPLEAEPFTAKDAYVWWDQRWLWKIWIQAQEIR